MSRGMAGSVLTIVKSPGAPGANWAVWEMITPPQ